MNAVDRTGRHRTGTTAALIPVRGGSRAIPEKNIHPFAGRPLLYWAARAACACRAIDHVYVATEDEKIADTARGLGFDNLSIFPRSARSATDTAPSEIVLMEFSRAVDFDTLVFLQATTPFTMEHHLQEALVQLADGGYDSLLSVVAFRRFLWRVRNQQGTPVNYHYHARPRRQEMDGCFLENGAFYISTRENLLAHRNRLGGRIGLYVMPEYSAVELDEPHDWRIAEALFRHYSPLVGPGD